jgi:hypothetical protein
MEAELTLSGKKAGNDSEPFNNLNIPAWLLWYPTKTHMLPLKGTCGFWATAIPNIFFTVSGGSSTPTNQKKIHMSDAARKPATEQMRNNFRKTIINPHGETKDITSTAKKMIMAVQERNNLT